MNVAKIFMGQSLLGLFSLLFGLVAVIYNDYQAVVENGFFQGPRI